MFSFLIILFCEKRLSVIDYMLTVQKNNAFVAEILQ